MQHVCIVLWLISHRCCLNRISTCMLSDRLQEQESIKHYPFPDRWQFIHLFPISASLMETEGKLHASYQNTPLSHIWIRTWSMRVSHQLGLKLSRNVRSLHASTTGLSTEVPLKDCKGSALWRSHIIFNGWWLNNGLRSCVGGWRCMTAISSCIRSSCTRKLQVYQLVSLWTHLQN